jgi:DNA primase
VPNPDAEIEELKRHPSVVHLYAQKIQLERNGNRLRGSCPFHQDSTPSLDVYNHNGVMIFNCLGCKKSGNIIQFIQGVDGISFPAAIKVVREFVQSSPQEKGKEIEQIFKPIGRETPKKVLTLDDIKKWELALETNIEAQEWLLKQRGITYETAKRFHTGYCKDVGKLCSDPEAQNKGWIVLPVVQGTKVLAVKFRSMAKKAFCKLTHMASDVLYNADTIDLMDPVFLTEGEFDAMVLEQAGFKAVSLPNANTKVSPRMREQLLEALHVVLAGDHDGGAGEEAMKKLKAAFGKQAVYLQWTRKDANETFLKDCDRDPEKFRQVVGSLVGKASPGDARSLLVDRVHEALQPAGSG